MAIIKCPECGHQVSDKAPTCPQCGVEIAGKITRCPQCGEVYFRYQQMCPVCHRPSTDTLDIPQPQQTTQQPRPVSAPPIPPKAATPQNTPKATAPQQPKKSDEQPKKKSYTTLIVSFIIALLVCGVAFYLYNDAKSSKEAEAYNYAMTSSDPLVLQSYLDNYLDAPEAHRDSIQAHLTMLKQVDEDWTNAMVSGSKSAIEAYLEKHPDSPHKAEAKHKIDSIDWAAATSLNTAESFQKYLDEHPDGDHVDDANDGLKEINAKTVQPEEKSMISSTFRTFFMAVNSRDEESLTSTVSSLMTSFLGKNDATKSDVRTFLQKIYKDDIQSMTWRLNNDYKIDKKEVGEDEYEYTVEFSAVQTVVSSDSEKNGDNHYRIRAKIGPDEKISMMNMTKIVQ